MDTERPVVIHGSKGVKVGPGDQINNFLVRPVVWVPALLLLLVSSVGATLTVIERASAGDDGQAARMRTPGPTIIASADSSARPAPADSPPVIVENVTPMRSNDAEGNFATAAALTLSGPQLDELNRAYAERSEGYTDWYVNHQGTAVDFAYTSFTLRGNRGEQVRIADMRAVKTCAAPYTGTYFKGHSQGSGDPLRIGFDLDQPDPVAVQLGNRGSGGMFSTGEPFFTLKVVTLDPGEKETFVVGAFSKTRSCSFSIRVVVATAQGSFFQDITQNGQPFRMTATAPATANGGPLSGYQRAYAYIADVDGSGGDWSAVDPATHGRR